jgi:hypothetical protein
VTRPVYESVEAQWAARTIEVPGGHLDWVGGPWLRWNGTLYRPARIAFRIRTGREPVGQVRPECGRPGCVAPGHVEDQPGRQRNRAQLRALRGLPPRPERCTHGHSQDAHGRLDEHGRAYCHPCAGHQQAAA